MNKIWSTLLTPRVWIVKLTLAVAIISFLGLGYLGYLSPIKKFLDSEALTFRLGETRLSLYLIVKAFLAIIVSLWITRIFSEFGEEKIKKLHHIKTSNRTLIAKGFQIVLYFVAFLIVLDVLGIDLTGLAIFSGAIGIGIGFGLQKVTSNFISGLILLFEKSVEEGDLVELDNGVVGFIKYTGARYTLVETFESREIMIPNEDFITNRVTNWTYTNNQGRIDIDVGVSYGSDLKKAYRLILEAANEHQRCSKNPKPECFLVSFGDNSINFKLYFWVDDIIEGRKRPKSDVFFSIWEKFNENGIEIPFPQCDLHIKSMESIKEESSVIKEVH